MSVAGDSVRVTVFVDVPPEAAFEVFTRDVNDWWREGVRFRAFPHDSTLSFQAGARFVETRSDGAIHEIGRVLTWEPGVRLSFEWKGVTFAPGEVTVVEIDFTAKRGGTEVVLVHRGWATIREDHPVRHGAHVAVFLRTMGAWWGALLGACRLHAK